MPAMASSKESSIARITDPSSTDWSTPASTSPDRTIAPNVPNLWPGPARKSTSLAGVVTAPGGPSGPPKRAVSTAARAANGRSSSIRSMRNWWTANVDTAQSKTPTAGTRVTAVMVSRVRSDRGRQRDSGCRLEDIPRSTLGVDHRLPSGVDLLAQVGDVDLHDVRLTPEVVVPHPVEDLRLGQHPSRVTHQEAEQLELRGRQLDLFAATRHLVAVLVEHEVADNQLRGLVARRR